MCTKYLVQHLTQKQKLKTIVWLLLVLQQEIWRMKGSPTISPTHPQSLLISFLIWSRTHILDLQSRSLYLFNFYRFSFLTQQHEYFCIHHTVFKFPWLPAIPSSRRAIIYVIISLSFDQLHCFQFFKRDVWHTIYSFPWNILNS